MIKKNQKKFHPLLTNNNEPNVIYITIYNNNL